MNKYILKIMTVLLAVLILGLSDAKASISNLTGQLGVYNSTDKQYGLEVDNNNDFYFATTGGSILYPTQTSTTAETLTISNSGQITVFTGTSSETGFTLPSCIAGEGSVGMDMDIISGVAKYFFMKPQSGDTIVFSTNTAGQSISNSGSAAVADEVELVCGSAHNWYVRNLKGTWAKSGD